MSGGFTWLLHDMMFYRRRLMNNATNIQNAAASKTRASPKDTRLSKPLPWRSGNISSLSFLPELCNNPCSVKTSILDSSRILLDSPMTYLFLNMYHVINVLSQESVRLEMSEETAKALSVLCFRDSLENCSSVS